MTEKMRCRNNVAINPGGHAPINKYYRKVKKMERRNLLKIMKKVFQNESDVIRE